MFRRDPLFGFLGLLAVLQALVLAVRLVYPDLNLDYPFMGGDSHDWIANGLRLAGHDVRSSGRAPMLPLLIALLERAGALSWLPVLLVALFHGTVLAFYTLAARLSSRGAAFAAALALMVCHSLLGLSLQVMADVSGAEVYQLQVGNSASLGAALRAWHGVENAAGRPIGWDDVIRGVVEPVAESRLRPRPEAQRVYQELMRVHAECEAEALGRS